MDVFQVIISWEINQNLKKVAGGMNHSVDPFENHSSRLGLPQPSNLIVTMVRSHLSSISSETYLKQMFPSAVKIVRSFRLLCLLQTIRESDQQNDYL